MIPRSEYLNRLHKYKDYDLIKVVTGVRRCGKSTLFRLYIEELIKEGISDSQIISINLEDLQYEPLLNYKALYEYILGRLNPDKQNYVFIDEVQNCTNYEKAVDSLHLKDNVDVYITGSNAYMLSGELATLLSGRYITIPMLPLSFKEYWLADQAKNSGIRVSFRNYLRYGGFPQVAYMDQDDEMVMPYIEGIYQTIVVKDVAQRADISDLTLLENIVKTLMSCVGSPVSSKKISDTLTSAGTKVASGTVDKYIRALCDSFLFYRVDRYDIKGRQHLKTQGKYYTVDTGVRNLLLSGSPDIGHLLENIVFLELIRRGYRVSIGKLDNTEVDFIATKMNDVEYYQVSASVLDENTLARELRPLERINDNHPKYILTLDDVTDGNNHNGIKQLDVVGWLLG